MKYVIEINDHPMNDPFTPALYRAKGFKTLVFDEYGLGKLTTLEKEIATIKEKAWKAGFAAGQQETQWDEGYEAGMEAMFSFSSYILERDRPE